MDRKDRKVDVFDIKRDVIQTLVEPDMINQNSTDDEAPIYFHPGKSGRIFLNTKKEKVASYFGEIHPNIQKKIDVKTEALFGLRYL